MITDGVLPRDTYRSENSTMYEIAHDNSLVTGFMRTFWQQCLFEVEVVHMHPSLLSILVGSLGALS